jgi:two-component system, OmpR family, sensor histidine kinase VicK
LVNSSDTNGRSALNSNNTSVAEKTEVVYGEQKTTKLTAQLAHNAKERIDCCFDSIAVAAATRVPQFREAIQYAKSRGVRLRYITQVSNQNISYCKKLAKLVELRHLDKVKGNFVVNESQSISTAIIIQEATPVPKAIYSDILEIVQQQQHFFETLWDKAIPAEQRIQEIEGGVELTRTRLIEDPNEIFAETKKAIEEAHSFSACITVDAMKLMRNYYENDVQKAVNRLRNSTHNDGLDDIRGFRWITDFEKQDIDTIQHFVNMGLRVRHVRNMIPMTFAVTNKRFIATVQELKGHGYVQTALISNDPNYIKHSNLLFEELWNKGIDASDRIRDIEQGRELGIIEVIDNSRQIQKIYFDMIASAKDEIMLIIPTTAFQREEKRGVIIRSLKEATKKGIKIRVLMPTVGAKEEEIQDKIKDLTEHGISIQFVFFPRQQVRIKVVIVDRKSSLVVELKNDSKETITDEVGSAVYATSRPTVLSYVTIFDSFWEQSELYERVREVNEKLEKHDKLQREFINIAAHELRTPVQPILGIIELTESSLTKDDHELKISKEDLEIIRRNAMRLQRLTSDILETARIEAGSLTLYRERFDVTELIKDTIKDIQQNQNTENIRLEHYYCRSSFDNNNNNNSIIVNADKWKITEVIWNLLDNAVKFTKQKGGTISALTEIKENQAIVKIKDTGKGIDVDMIPRLFSKFATKSERGTGLGLFISKSIVEAHGGKIWAENNKDGEGATFTFTLPMAAEAQKI